MKANSERYRLGLVQMKPPYNKTDSVDHVISTGHQMMNLVSSFECLFWFFSANIKIWCERSPIHLKYLFIIPWRYPKFHDSAAVKKHSNNRYFEFDTKFVIWCPVEMTWSRHHLSKFLSDRIQSFFCLQFATSYWIHSCFSSW